MLRARLLFFFLFISLVSLLSCSRSDHLVPGYIEGRYTYMAVPVSGILEKWYVKRGMQVKKGQLLFVLQTQPESDAYAAALDNLQQSIAARDAILANLSYAKKTYDRYQILVRQKASPQSQLDDARSDYHALLAQLTQANAAIASSRANLAQTKWTMNQKKVVAPVNALVFDTYYRLGEYTIANRAILSLLAPSDVKAIFYVNEFKLHTLKLNDRITIHCDSCLHPYAAKISFISPTAEYTPPVIYSNETTEKLIYRIEAEFDPLIATQLHPGQPIMVSEIHD